MTARRVFLCVATLASLVLPVLAYGQTSQSALAGVVRDSTGGVLPGVTVEAASPALIERVRAVTTDSSGVYRVVDLRPGVYTVTFTLPGFNTVRVQSVELRADFTATVNADMAVGELSETISVTSEAPLVDVQSTTRSAVFSSYLINGAVVHATPTRAGTGSYTEGEKTHGAAGIRIDGAVDLQVDGFEVQQPFTPPVRGQ